MKRHTRTLLRLAALLLSAVFVCAAPAAAMENGPLAVPFRLLDGVGWDTAADALDARVGITDPAKRFTYEDNGYQTIGFTLTLDGTAPMVLTAVYNGDQMVLIALYYEESEGMTFATELAQTEAALGPATRFDRAKVVQRVNLVVDADAAEDEITKIAGWEYADGTLAYLLEVDEELGFFYFNESALTAIQAEEPAPAAEPLAEPATAPAATQPPVPAAEPAATEAPLTALAPAAAPETFAFRGLGWQSAAWEVEEAEAREAMLLDEEGMTVLVFTSASLDGEPVDVAYYFAGEQMIIAAYYFPEAPPEAFDRLLAQFSADYGTALPYTPEEAAALFNAVVSDSFRATYISAVSGWKLMDGTEICLLDLDGDLALFCFNTPLLPEK